MHLRTSLIATLALLLGLCAGARAADAPPQNKKAEPNAPPTMMKVGQEELLLPPNWTFTIRYNDQKWIQCDYDCPGGTVSNGWDYDYCKTQPECNAMLEKFKQDAAEYKQAEDKKAKEEKSRTAEAERIAQTDAQNDTNISAGWTTCINPDGGTMSCRDYLAQKNTRTGSPNERLGVPGPREYGRGAPPAAATALGLGWPPGAEQEYGPAVLDRLNPDTGITGVMVPVDPKVYDTMMQFTPLFRENIAATNIGAQLPEAQDLIDRVSSEVMSEDKTGNTLFDNAPRGLQDDVTRRERNTNVLGLGGSDDRR